MKNKEIIELSESELTQHIAEGKQSLLAFRTAMATNHLENPMKIRETRKDIARAHTELTRRKIEAHMQADESQNETAI